MALASFTGRKTFDPVPYVSVLANLTTDMNFDLERMAVNPGALVAGRNIGQVVCGFHLENSENIHRRIVPIRPM